MEAESTVEPTRPTAGKVRTAWRLWRRRTWKGLQWFKPHIPRAFTTGDGLAFASIVITIFLTIGQWLSANRAADLQNSQEFTKMALGVLGREAKIGEDGEQKEFSADVQVLREWAVKVINDGAEEHLRIPEKAVPALISGESSIRYGGFDYNTGYDSFSAHYYPPSNFGGSDYSYDFRPKKSPPGDQSAPESE